MARVTLEALTKLYPGNAEPSVRGIDLDIGDREFIVLVGPSGCGKSTTLRMVAGLEEITSGTVRIGERVVNDLPPKDRGIAMVSQNYALYPYMTVYDNMAFALTMQRKKLGLSREQIRGRVMEAAKRLGIVEHLERKPRALSGGERQRVAVGRAIVRNPKAFLFDEPLSNLDATLRLETRAQLKRLHMQLQTTTIYVTHDQEEAMTLGDRIVVMKEGVIQQCAPPLEVYERPVNRFVAGFVGTPAMNFLPGRIEGGSFVVGVQRMTLPESMGEISRQYEGRELVLGVRPEGLSPGCEGRFSAKENVFHAKVNAVAPLGEKVDLSVLVEGMAEETPMVCRVDAHQFGKTTLGSIIRLFVDLSRVHLFEPGGYGVNITLTRESHAVA